MQTRDTSVVLARVESNGALLEERYVLPFDLLKG